MSKFRKIILIIGILVVMVAASLATALALLATGTIKTDPVELVYAVHDAEKIYDGTPLKASEYRLTKGELLPGHTAQVEFLGSQTSVGSSQSDLSVKIYDAQGYNVTSSYAIKVINGELTVDKKSVKITMPSQKVVYNGSKVLFEEYSVADPASNLVNGHKIYGSAEAKLLNVGDKLPEGLKPLVFDVAGNEVTENYDIDFKIGEIEVIPRPISVRPVSYEKVYDGKTIFAEEYEFVEGSLVEGQWAEFEINKNYNNMILNAGEVETSVTSFKIYETVNGKNVEVTNNYDVSTHETGYLKVTPRPLTVYAPSETWVYNGAERNLEDVETVESEGLAETDEILGVTFYGSRTEVGKTESRIHTITVNCSEKNYDVTFVDGVLEITPYELTITTASDEQYYNGKDLWNSSTEISTPYEVNALANAEHGIDIELNTDYPSIKNAGSISNAYKCRIYTRNGISVTKNYAITYNYGTLTVNKMPVAVTLGVDETTYDGTPHEPDLSKDGQLKLEAVDGSALDIDSDDFETVSSSRVMQDAKEYSYTVRFADKANYGNYDLEIKNTGYYKINERKLAVGTGDKSRSYNGSPLSDGEYVFNDGTSLAAKHNIKLPEVLPSITDYGKVVNEFKVTVVDETGTDVTKNYALSYSYGYLEITACKVNVKLNSFSTEFNNRNYQVKVEEAVEITFADGGTGIPEGGTEAILTPKDFSIIYLEDILHVKTDQYGLLASYDYSAEIADKRFAKNFTVTITNESGYGKVMVTKRKITATVKDVITTYNGEGYVLDQYAAIYELSDTTTGLSRDDFKVTFTGDYNTTNKLPTNYVDGGYIYTVDINADKKGDYELKVVNFASNTRTSGKLTINKYRVTITSATVSLVYNGQSQACGDFTSTALVKSDHKIFVTNLLNNEVRLTGVDEKANALEYEIYTVKPDGTKIDDVTINYEIVKVNGKLKITRRPITLTTESIKITYDGETAATSYDGVSASTPSAVTANADALIEGHQVAWDGNGTMPSITEAGELENAFRCKIYDGDTDYTDNYEISYFYGTLCVEKRKVTLQTSSESKIYNTVAVSDDTLTLVEFFDEEGNEIIDENGNLVNSFALDHEARILESETAPSLCNVGTLENRFDYAVYNGEGKDVTKNYECEVLWGKFEIKPCTIELTLNDFTDINALTYNGKEQTVEPADEGDLAAIDLIDYPDSLEYPEYFTNALKGKIREELSFKINYYGKTVQDAGKYEYTVEFDETVNADNFVLIVKKAKITVNKMTLNVYLSNLSYDFDDTVKSFKTTDKIDDDYVLGSIYADDGTEIFGYDTEEGAYASDCLLKRSDFVVSADEEMRYVKYEIDEDGNENAVAYKYTVKFAEKENEKNFEITGDNGKVLIRPLELSLGLKYYYVDYSGEEFAINPEDAVTVKNSDLISGRNFTVIPSMPIINANVNAFAENENDRGYYSYTVSITDKKYAKNFRINEVPVLDEDGLATGDMQPAYGKVTVKPLKVGVYLRKYNYVYANANYEIAPADAIVTDSRLLTADKFTVSIQMINDEGEKVAVTGIKDAGNYTYTAELTGEIDKNNFSLQAVKSLSEIENKTKVTGGEVTVSKFEVQVSLKNLTHIYDGMPFNLEGNKGNAIANIIDNDLIKEEDLYLQFEELTDEWGSPISTANVGTYSYKVCVGSGMEKNFKLTYNKASVTVASKEITVYTAGDSKPFDGEVLQLGNAWTDEDALIVGHALAFDETLTPMICDVGSVVNEFEIDIVNGAASMLGNYRVFWEYGTLTVTERPITITTETVKKVYDGTTVGGGNHTIAGMEEIIGFEVKPVNEDKVPVLTGVGSADNAYLCKIVTVGHDEDGNETEIDATANFEISYVYGTLSVTERQVIVQVNSDIQKTYTGRVISLDVNEVVLGATAVPEEGDELPEEYIYSLVQITDLCVDYGSVVVRNAGSYGYKVKFADESNAKNFNITVIDENETVIEGNVTFTVNRLGVHIVKDETISRDWSAYNGKVQTVPMYYTDEDGYAWDIFTVQIIDPDFEFDPEDPVEPSLINPDNFDMSYFKIVYPEAMLNAKVYNYTFEFKNSVWYQNYEIIEADWYYEILRLQVELRFNELNLIYNGKDQTSAVTAGMTIDGDGASYLSASDFTVRAIDEDAVIKMINAGDYNCEVKFVNSAAAQNFYFIVNGEEADAENVIFTPTVTIAQRKVALKLNTVYVSAQEWSINGGEGGEYSVVDELVIDSAYSLGESDRFTVTTANGVGDEEGYIDLDVVGALEYAFFNAEGEDVSGNYEVINEGTALRARLIGLSS